MAIEKLEFQRLLKQETLQRVSFLSIQLDAKGLNIKVTAEAIGPHVDEIRLIYPDGQIGVELIEEA